MVIWPINQSINQLICQSIESTSLSPPEFLSWTPCFLWVLFVFCCCPNSAKSSRESYQYGLRHDHRRNQHGLRTRYTGWAGSHVGGIQRGRYKTSPPPPADSFAPRAGVKQGHALTVCVWLCVMCVFCPNTFVHGFILTPLY